MLLIWLDLHFTHQHVDNALIPRSHTILHFGFHNSYGILVVSRRTIYMVDYCSYLPTILLLSYRPTNECHHPHIILSSWE